MADFFWPKGNGRLLLLNSHCKQFPKHNSGITSLKIAQRPKGTNLGISCEHGHTVFIYLLVYFIHLSKASAPRSATWVHIALIIFSGSQIQR